MYFPIVIHKDQSSDYGVIVPDLPGCYSAGDTMDEAMAMAKEAVEAHIEGLLLDGGPVPAAQAIEEHQAKPEYVDADFWAVVDVDLSSLSGKAQRINLTVPDLFLRQIDDYASAHGMTRSGLMVQGALAVIRESASGRTSEVKAPPKQRKSRKGRVPAKTESGVWASSRDRQRSLLRP